MVKCLSEVVDTIKKIRRWSEALNKEEDGLERVIQREGTTGSDVSQLFLCPQCSKAGILKRKKAGIVNYSYVKFIEKKVSQITVG